MQWTVEKIEIEGRNLAEVTLKTGQYKKPGYALMYVIVPLAHAPLFPLGQQFTMSDLMPAFQSGSPYSPDTEAENRAKPTLTISKEAAEVAKALYPKPTTVERQAGIDMVPEQDPEVR